jgi:hypothetical protein
MEDVMISAGWVPHYLCQYLADNNPEVVISPYVMTRAVLDVV